MGGGIGHNRQTNVIDEAISTIGKLPGLGPRSAKRIVLHLLRRKDKSLDPLIEQLSSISESVVRCECCNNLDVISPCNICQDQSREESTICVVEDVADVWAMERAKVYNGRYHVLGGVLSAIDGIGPDGLGVPLLLSRIQKEEIKEIILATNSTADGQTTAHYLYDVINEYDQTLQITRLAQGVPIGGELDHIDEGTLGAALRSRTSL